MNNAILKRLSEVCFSLLYKNNSRRKEDAQTNVSLAEIDISTEPELIVGCCRDDDYFGHVESLNVRNHSDICKYEDIWAELELTIASSLTEVWFCARLDVALTSVNFHPNQEVQDKRQNTKGNWWYSYTDMLQNWGN